MNKIFEIPYNFDFEWLEFLKIYDSEGSIYSSIYFPPFWNDYKSAKYYTKLSKDINQDHNMTKETYLNHIKKIQEYFPGKGMLLLQQNNYCMEEEKLQEYYDLGIRQFCVGSINQAKNLKMRYNNIIVYGSITMKVNPEELRTNMDYYKYFDGFVLFFPYNRDLDTVRNLPSTFKYILLVNCDCSILCGGTHHWFAKNKEEEQWHYCPKNDPANNIFSKKIFIRPTDLPIWRDYIFSFKLQGREFDTKELINNLVAYNMNYNYFFINYDLNANYNDYIKK